MRLKDKTQAPKPKVKKARFTINTTLAIDTRDIVDYDINTGEDVFFEGNTTEEYAAFIQKLIDEAGSISDFLYNFELLSNGQDKIELDVELLP